VVRVGPWRFRVVGVLAPRGRSLTFNMDDLVLIPVRTAMRVFNRSSLFRILVDVRMRDEMELTKKDVEKLMAVQHRAEDVTVITQDALLSAFSSILNALTLALVGIAAVSLAVAGVGIMNVMLVSVTERRAEIGLLKALGAPRPQIITLFLTEAGLISLAGALCGLGIGVVGIRLLAWFLPQFPIILAPWAPVVAMAVAQATGLVFGILPARRAADLAAADALSRR